MGRLAARRVIWIIVGIVVYAMLNAAGVRAYVYDSGTATMSDVGVEGGNALMQNFSIPAGDTFTVTITQQFSSGNIDMNCSGYNGAHQNPGAAGWSYSWTPGAATTGCNLFSWSHSTGKTGAISWTLDNGDPEPTPTPTPTPTATPTPTPTPTPAPILACDPSCVVTLSPEDVTRMENMANTIVLGMGLLIVGVAIATVLVYKP